MNPDRKYRGQSLVELALVTPILLLMLLFTADGVRVFTAHIQIGNAAREGANHASRSLDNANNDLEVRNSALQEVGAAGTIFEVAPTVEVQSPDDGCVDDYGYECVRVTVTYAFTPLFDFPGLPGEIDLERSAEMRLHFLRCIDRPQLEQYHARPLLASGDNVTPGAPRSK